MPGNAVVVFTAKPLGLILRDQGSGDWRLDATRTQRTEYLVCTQNRQHPRFGMPAAPHRAAFLIGRICDVVPSPERAGRWLIKIDQYLECNIPEVWGKSGHLRYPVWYTTLDELGISLASLPPFRSLPGAQEPEGFAEAGQHVLIPAPAPAATSPGRGGNDMGVRLDTILAQLDRIPDLAAPGDPFGWDEHGLPA